MPAERTFRTDEASGHLPLVLARPISPRAHIEVLNVWQAMAETAETVEVTLSRTVLARLVRNLTVAEPHIALVSFPGGASVRQQFVLARQTGARTPTVASLPDIPLSRMTGVQP